MVPESVLRGTLDIALNFGCGAGNGCYIRWLNNQEEKLLSPIFARSYIRNYNLLRHRGRCRLNLDRN